jgi:hypothetical protein
MNKESFKKEKEEKEENVLEEDPTEMEDEEEIIEEKNDNKLSLEEKAKQEKENNRYLEKLIELYYQSTVNYREFSKKNELEVRFGTGQNVGRFIKPFTKNDYDNVIKKMKSLGFTSLNENGEYTLRIQNEFLDKRTGRFKVSNIRTEINGFHLIQEYCRTSNISELIKKASHSVKFTKKESAVLKQSSQGPGDSRNFVKPVYFNDFNFRVSYDTEEESYGLVGVNRSIIENWKNSKKTFRYINRVTFLNPDYPIKADISIVKTSMKQSDKRAGYKLAYTMEEAGVFTNQETYEIELEIDNERIGPGTKFNTASSVLDAFKKCIKYVLSGLQGTNYPVSYVEQKDVIDEYRKMLFPENFDPKKPVYNSQFIGPSSYTLQMQNVAPLDENSTVPNIRQGYTVTEKADGERNLLFIAESGKIYLINTNMQVIFTGAKTEEKEFMGTLIDGELILRDKSGVFINLYAAFDLYYLKKKDVRGLPFITRDSEKKESKVGRYQLLKNIMKNLNPVSILSKTKPKQKTNSSLDSLGAKFQKDNDLLSPLRISVKEFYPLNPETESIFEACRLVLSKSNAGIYEYNTDGLIFTPAFLGVGATEESKPGQNVKVGPLSKMTWEYSFKWKPPQYNTIDFLVTTIKTVNGEDTITPIFEEGINTMQSGQLSEYKTIQLRCTFIERLHGYINPCQDVIEDKLPEFDNSEEKVTKEAKPVQFYPTNPYDPDAGIAKIMLRRDDNNVLQMFTEEGEVFQSDSIVEFRYDLDLEKGWRWVPLRMRYDKTFEYRQGISNYGNAYHVANSNWQSIHNPITEEMICSGTNIPDLSVNEDIYYNRISTGGRASSKTDGLRDFHNLYVKRKLILGVSKRGDTLIDYACGKAGDFPKWIAAHLSFVFGIDLSRDNLENRLDGACARFLNYRKKNKMMPYALFVNGNSAFNIRNGSALLSDKAVQITNAVFGKGLKDEEKLGKGVARQYGKGQEGFQVSSCQFALHYMWENPEMLTGFLRNLAECTKLEGYFIGTCYDGATLFQLLKKKQVGESIEILEDDKKIWEVRKGYEADEFKDDASSIGYRIDVFQETINQLIPEYLVNFDYFNQLMENYGFKVIDRTEAQTLGFPEGSGLFSELYAEMENELKKTPYKKKDYGEASTMNANERKISFLNRYFIYKKIRNVNAEKVEVELEDYNINVSKAVEDIDKKATEEAVKVAKRTYKKREKKVEKEEKEEKAITTKVRKTNKKIILVPATEKETL